MGDSKKLEVGGEELRRIHLFANRRKQGMYWIGFLEGALSSGRIERAELPALEAEARTFADFFDDPDARDVAEDIAHVHAEESNDLYEQISDVIDAQRVIVCREEELTAKDRLNEFLGFCAGIVCDGRVLEREAIAISERFKRDRDLTQHPLLVKQSDRHRGIGRRPTDRRGS